MPVVGGLYIPRKQITFDYLDTATGEVKRGQIALADRKHVRAWLARFAGRDEAAFAVEGCTRVALYRGGAGRGPADEAVESGHVLVTRSRTASRCRRSKTWRRFGSRLSKSSNLCL
jgi:hypothetical protein